MTDAEMSDVNGKKEATKMDQDKKEEKKEEKKEADVPAALRRGVALVEKAVSSKQAHLTSRLLRLTVTLRRQLTAPVLHAFLQETLPASTPLAAVLLEAVACDSPPEPASQPKEACLIETEVFCSLLVTLFVLDAKRTETAVTVTSAAVKRMESFNSRSLDVLAARLWYYYSWAHELAGRLDSVRSTLLAALRTSTLRHDNIGQEVLLNLLLRNYLHYNLYDLAEKLRSKTEMPESRSNQQYCRYLYYLGRIRAVQLEYTGAKDCLVQASRKAPGFALGFRVEVHKWMTLVRLLLGDIPERSSFTHKGMAKPLLPYFEITQAVRVGDLSMFKTAVEKYESVFTSDKTLNLINRLRRNVIRTGLRRVNLAYSRISLEDVAVKLGLGLTDDAACLVAKAIRDGGVDAQLDFDQKCMMSKEVVDVYSTQEPQAAFHSRIAFCLDTYNEAVRAMRYPPDSHKKGLETAEARKERLQQEQELAKHIAEEEDEDF